MAGKRRHDDTVRPKKEGTPLNPTTLNPNWAQLKTKLNSYTQRRTHFKPEAKITQVRASGGKSSADNPEVSADGTSSMPGSFQPVNDDCSLTDAVAMDCEMVGVGSDGSRDALARVTLVNAWGNAIYDEYVRPIEVVSDFRSNISGVRAHHLRKAKDLWSVQKEVSELIKGRILVGHALQNDLKVLFLSHPKKDIRDTSSYKPLRSKEGRARALRDLAAEIFGVKIQEKEHCSGRKCILVGWLEWFECLELHVEGLGVDFPGWLPLLHPSLDFPTGSGVVISAERSTMSSICRMRGSARGIPRKVFLGEKWGGNVEDARAALFLYQKFKKEWEKSIRDKRKKVRIENAA